VRISVGGRARLALRWGTGIRDRRGADLGRSVGNIQAARPTARRAPGSEHYPRPIEPGVRNTAFDHAVAETNEANAEPDSAELPIAAYGP
jgi:hypothetical protein